MNKNILIFFLLLIAFYVSYSAFRTRNLLKNAAILVKQSHSYEQTPSHPTKTILIWGDSTAVGTGSESNKNSVAGRFGTLFPQAKIINQGFNGQKIHQLANSLSHSVEPLADLLVIQIGANDILRFTPISKIKIDLEIVLKQAVKLSPKVAILHSGNVGLAPFFPKPFGIIWSWKSRQVRALYMEETARYGVVYVDLYANKTDDIFLTDPKKYYASDLLHPSGEGYKVWFDTIINELKQKYGENIF